MANSTRLKIGLYGFDPYWKLLLDQIGVDWITIDDQTVITPSTFSIIILNQPCSTREERVLEEYTTAGGILLYTTNETKQVQHHSIAHRYIAFLLPQNNREYYFHDVFDINKKIYFFRHESLISIEPQGNGFISYLGIDIPSLLSDHHLKRKSFYVHKARLPHEIVAQTSKRPLRQMIKSFLEYAHHLRNLPFIHKWYFPDTNHTIFTFRIDSDKGTQEQIDELFQISEQCRIPTTWFLDVKSHEQWLPYFKKFTSQEIGVHCYEHVVHTNTALNKENFEKALSLLTKQGFTVYGISAPTGAWSNSIGTAIRELNFSYSSEFEYDYDNVPSFPYIVSEFSPTVQLPIHPVCIGTMSRERMTIEEMIAYYKNMIDKNILLREPICLYHHPSHQHNEVLREIFTYINDKNILKLSFRDYAEWWKRRHRFKFEAVLNDSTIAFHSSNTSNDTMVRISLPNNTETICSANDIVLTTGTKWQTINHQTQTPSDFIRIRKTTFRHYIQNALDWWIKITE